MPKVNRTLQAELEWNIDDEVTNFDKWASLNNDNGWIPDLDVNNVADKANKLGVTPDELLEQNYEKYNELRQTWHTDLDTLKEEKQQLLTIRNNLLDSVASVYERADSILTGLDIEVRIGTPAEEVPNAPAWNDGKVISFNETIIKDNDDNTIMGIHGLNYHEVAHLLYSPRIGTELGQWVMENNYQTTFNILEDNRAETYLVEKYPATRDFLIATVGDYIVNTPDKLAENFILLAGRRYFSYQTRLELGKAFASKYGTQQARTVWLLINKYRTLVFPRDYGMAKFIIKKLSTIIPPDLDTPSGCGPRRPLKNGRPVSGKEQSEMNLSSDEVAPDFSPDNSTQTDDEQKGKQGGNGYSNKGDDENKTVAPQAQREQSALDRLTQEVAKAKSKDEVIKKVRDTQLAISKTNNSKSLLSKKSSETLQPQAIDISTARMFAQELEQMRIEADPAWDREKPSGRLNMKRAMNADLNEIGKLFDRWSLGNDNYDMEAVVLLDHSGSMSRDINAVCRSAWVVKRAIEQIQGRVTVLTFNHVSKLLYSADERATSDYRHVYSSGGTDPSYALLETERLMLASDKPTKLVILLTDGAFYGNCDETIKRLNEQGCITCVVYLGNPDYDYSQQYSHGAQVFRAIADPSNLVVVAKDLVRQRLRVSR